MAAQTVAGDEEGFKLLATRDFDPRKMSKRETMQLDVFLKSQGLLTKGNELELDDTVQGGILMEYLNATKQIKDTFKLQLKKEKEELYKHVCHFQMNMRDYERLPSKTVDLYSVVLTFKRGSKMQTFPPANIGDSVGWWMVRKLESGQIGFIPRNRVVIESYQEASKTALNELPLELMDVVLENSFLQWTMNTFPLQRHEDVIKTLASVDFCWYQRVTRRRFRKEIWHRLKDYSRKIKRTSAIIRNNRNYLLEYLQPNDELTASLLSLNCITQEQSHFIEGQHSKRDKNEEILRVVRSFDEIKFSNFIRCLRKTNQKTVARIMDNGGVVIKVDVQTRGADGRPTTSLEAQPMFHRILEDVRNRTQPWSQPTFELISRLKEDGLEILNCQLDRRTVVFWIWCHSQTALENLQRLLDSNQLKDIFFGFANIEPSISEIIHSMVINIDNKQFKKTVAMCPISINFTEIIDIQRKYEELCGVTTLSNEIYVLSRQTSDFKNIIRVFADQNPFPLMNKIEIKLTNSYSDIVSSEKERCVYVADGAGKCIRKITKDIDEELIITKWLTADCHPNTLSVSSFGHLLVVSEWSSHLSVYGSDAELIRSIQLPEEFMYPNHAVETSIGNYIIISQWWIYMYMRWAVSELSRDGQMVIRRFNPSNESQRLICPSYLSLDSDDRLFVADCGKDKVVLLDSDLKWNRILCPTKKEEGLETSFQRMHYDEGKKQLICTGYSHPGLNVYTLSRK